MSPDEQRGRSLARWRWPVVLPRDRRLYRRLSDHRPAFLQRFMMLVTILLIILILLLSGALPTSIPTRRCSPKLSKRRARPADDHPHHLLAFGRI